MGKAEREGWNTWNRYVNAGVVEETLLWTDEAVLVDNTIGRTKELLGKCWPIDAAVAYTLANHGENAALTWSDLVNQNTRIASVMMTGMVGYGELKSPLLQSCGHDIVDCHVVTLLTPVVKDGCIKFSSVRGAITKWSKWDHMPTELHKLCIFRVDEVKNSESVLHYLSTEECKPLVEWLCAVLECDKFGINSVKMSMYENDDGTAIASYYHFGIGQGYEYEHTSGVCGFTKDNPNYGSCSHHDSAMKKAWYMVNDKFGDDNYMTIWRRGKGRVVRSNWNRDQFSAVNINKYAVSVDRVTLFDRVKRPLAQTIPEDVVIKHIRESLQRMRNWNGRNLVSKIGIGKNAKHTWANWSWLTEMGAWVQDTLSKNRKENETACSTCYSLNEVDDASNSLCRCGDGWKYTKYNVKKSYGHEIAKFQWTPIESPTVYTLGVGDKHLSYYFNTKEEAAQFRTFIPLMIGKMSNVGSTGHRVWDLSTGSEVLNKTGTGIGLSLKRHALHFNMKWDVDPENTLTAAQLKYNLMFGSPAEQNDAFDLCKSEPKIEYNQWGRTETIQPMKLINAADNVMNTNDSMESE